MEIIQLNLKHFGKFTDYRLDLHAGINIISGGNETGKSTLHAFIRAMLYGITRNRSRSLDEYQLREPWENPSYFAGSMKLLHEGKIYRIDRNFHRRDESVEVVCETDGTRAEDPLLAISCFTGGMSEVDFDNTVFIRQAQPAANAQLSGRLRDCLVNREMTADESLDVSAAQDYLKKKRRQIEQEKNDELGKIEEEIREKTRESEYINRDLERLLERRSQEGAEEETASFERIPDTPGREDEGIRSDPETGTGGGEAPGREEEAEASTLPDEPVETSGVLLPVMVLLSFAAAILMCACAFLASDQKLRYLTAAGAALIGIVAVFLLWRLLHPVSKSERVRRRMKREAFLDRHLGFREDPEDPDDIAESMRREQRARDKILRARQEEERDQQQREEKRRAQIETLLEMQEKEDRERRGRDVERIARSQVLGREISLRREKLDTLRSELEELYRSKASASKYDEEIRAVEMAQSRIQELSGSIYHESGAEFAAQVSAILAGLTDGRYTRISLDEKNLVRLNTPDRLLTLEQVSFGTMQQVYFALRLASAGLLSKRSDVPIILDEPFAMYDEERLESALRLLSGSARQVILFSCQARELDILSKLRS